ncbi:MAG TPA: altronate dehydratase family protein [Acidobacteriaceae bacterium]|jgi:altronate hydrolase
MTNTSLPSPPLAVRLHPLDDVVIARQQLVEGMSVAPGVAVRGFIPAGHKVATHVIAQGELVRRYGQIIGVATREIRAGEHVHTQNLAMISYEKDYGFAQEIKPTVEATPHATFMGIQRPDGRFATRNYLGILSTVNCSATVARAIADHFRKDIHPEELAQFPNVDGVVALTHGLGCATDAHGEDLALIRRTLGGYARHANFAAILIVGLGCETNNIDGLMTSEGLDSGPTVKTMTIQSSGGTAKTVTAGIAQIRQMLPAANQVARSEVDASHLVVGLQCGGSDGYSGISANPALGAAVDRLVANGGTAILSETPEIYGAEHLLTRRAISPQVGEKLVARVHWWEDYCTRMRADMNNNPSTGNKAGGLTTILEKSLGAVAKGGTTNLVDVYEYAEPVRARGLVFMDTPGYDPVSATGQVAGGANLICFTTGRGSAYGCAPSPSIKLSSNTALWDRQSEDIDLNCGSILDGAKSIDEMGEEIFRLMLETASGKFTKSELHGYGQNEFVPWHRGATM